MVDVYEIVRAEQLPLWDAINEYVITCGGDPSRYVYGNTPRSDMVVRVNQVVSNIATAAASAEIEKLSSRIRSELLVLIDNHGIGGPSYEGGWKSALAAAIGLLDNAARERFHQRVLGKMQRIGGE